MMSSNIIQENIDYIASKFPNALKEVKENGKTVKKIDFDILKQELSSVVIDDRQERYQMTWPDKKKSILLANSRINATLRPDKEKSVDFDNTQNIYIEGDNLDVLKLLRETYLNKVRIIYIDPPYNTGNNFVYNDKFLQDVDEYYGNSGQFDEQGNRLTVNKESNGRFHTDWLNMMYPRLKIAKDLLSEDGAVFVSIDEHEHSNLIKIMNEIFGVQNYVESIVWDKKAGAKGVPPKNMIVNVHEYIVVYQKSADFKFTGEERDAEKGGFKNPDNDPRGPWRMSNIKSTTKPIEDAFTITDPNTGKEYTNTWAFSKESLDRMIREDRILWKNKLPKQKEFLHEMTNDTMAIKSNWGVFDAQSTTVYLKKILPKVHFDNPKPIKLMKYLLGVSSKKDDLIMDFFSGSGTTAQAVMELNSEDGGKRKYIMVQVPENYSADSKAYKEGIRTICDIGENRIRISGELLNKNRSLISHTFDSGFRVLRLDSSNMNDVYYNPNKLRQLDLDELVTNVKEDRTPLDLLFQVMLELGIELSAKIEEKEFLGKKYFVVNENDIVACFDDGIDDDLVKELAKIHSIYAVFKDSAFSSDSANINCEQIFKSVSPSTNIKVI
jgi:adenine-specific DNA-methyltransferase